MHALRHRAHPRVCGENGGIAEGKPQPGGSSPRVRGKLSVAAFLIAIGGLIPACAGKTRASSRPSSLYRAHPRVCGENSPSHPASYTARGSSPRVRGKPSSKLNPRLFRGLIPACAGKTVSFQGMNALKPAHPRVCGENWKLFLIRRNEMGSSPRVRGKPFLFPSRRLKLGLIPACAGKTVRKPAPPLIQTAHPRVCGENFLIPLKTFVMTGSSPRVRGKRLLA